MVARKEISATLGGLCFLLASINLLTLEIGATTGSSSSKRAAAARPLSNANSANQSDSLADANNAAPMMNSPSTSCDLLLSANDNFASYCQCKDADLDIIATNGGDNLWQISQLNCYPQNFSQIILDLGQLSSANYSSNLAQIQVDYFSITTNLTQWERLAKVAQKTPTNRLLIDHISLQLTLVPSNDDPTRTIIDSSVTSRSMEEQMIDFVRLINETHLQFLSIFLEPDNNNNDTSGCCNNTRLEQQQQQQRQQQPRTGNGRAWSNDASAIKFNRLFALLGHLSRLELSLGQRSSSLLLDSETLKDLGKLRWLNLASNAQIMFDRNIVSRSPFTYCPHLEYLSLESSNLASFPLYSLFTVPLSATTTTSPLRSDAKPAMHHYVGLPNLTSLNLANNKLASFEDHLFTRIATTTTDQTSQDDDDDDEKHDNNGLLLPALTQLDLSHNRLRDITLRTGQLLLLSMPNLNQLYLQHNKIIHLNLNSLLAYPAPVPSSFLLPLPDQTNGTIAATSYANHPRPNENSLQSPMKFSQLEHIDLSHNQLLRITAFQWTANTNTTAPQTRIKSINLNYNRLQLPVSLLDSKWLDKLLFEETFDFGDASEGLVDLDSLFKLDSSDSGAVVSICDFLSPASSKQSVGNNDLVNEILLTNNQLSLVDSKQFSSKQCRDVQILRLSDNRLESLASDALFELRSLEQLDLSNNLISHLNEETFVKNNRLRILDLSRNRLNSIKRNLFSQNTELESISLNNNQLLELPNELFAHNQQLEIIDLSNNKLNHLNDLIFQPTRYLRVLNIAGNQLRKLTYQAAEIPNVRGSSSSNLITQVSTNSPISSSKSPTSANKRFGSLKGQAKQMSQKRRQIRETVEGANVLVLTANQIDFIQFDECNQFGQNIQLLWLDDNRLKELQDTSFKCFRSVQRLYLNSNRIRSIGDVTFQHLKQLKYIDLSNNLLGQLRPIVLNSLGTLSHLDLSNNRLMSFQLIESFVSARTNSETFGDPTQIELINLGGNPELVLGASDLLTFLNRLEINQLELGGVGSIKSTGIGKVALQRDRYNFQTLNLSSIGHLDDELIRVLSHSAFQVEKVDLSYSFIPISELANLLDTKFTNDLIELNLNGNDHSLGDIRRLFITINDTIQLQVLNISKNTIESWPFTTKTAQNLSKLRQLDLSKNKIRHFIRDEINSYSFSNLETLNLSSNALISLVDHPKYRMMSLRNLMPRIKHLDLSHNRLSWIPLQFLDDMSELQLLKLDNNQLESLLPIYAHQRLVLDLSMNHKLRTIGGGSEIKFQLDELEDDGDFIIYDDHADLMPQLMCYTVDDYIRAYKKKQEDKPLVGSSAFSEWNALDDDERIDTNKCQMLSQMIDSVRIDSAPSLINLHSIRSEANKYLHLSFRHNGINHLETSAKNKDILKLDLSENKIQHLPHTLCRDLPELRSLDLSHNSMDHIPNNIVTNCSHLSYIDLSYNKINSMAVKADDLASSALLVLRLTNNMLRDLSEMDMNLFKGLRFLDVRFNQLKANAIIPQTQYVRSLDTLPYMKNAVDNYPRLNLKLSDTSLVIDEMRDSYHNSTQQSYSLTVHRLKQPSDNISIVYQPDKSQHLISFCALKLNDTPIKICLTSRYLADEMTRCFPFKTPKHMLPCLTNLHEPLSRSVVSNTTITTSRVSSWTKDGIADPTTLIDTDPVISFIDGLRMNWLKLKELDILGYVATIINVQNDTILTNLNGNYPVYTSTLVRLLLVGGSLSIIALLVAMFALLTCRSSNESKNLSSGSSRGSTHVLSTDVDITDSSITNTSSKLTLQTCTTSSSQNCGGSQSKFMNDDVESHLEHTVMGLQAPHQQLDPHRLLLKQQACSTPSPSIAPSSVETAETLQAVDSIKSGTPIQAFGQPIKCSIDQYAERGPEINNINQQHYPIATVMRMVKSSSTDFYNTNRNSLEQQGQNYGTTNDRRMNYPTLKSRLRSIYETQHQKNQIFPTNQTQLNPESSNEYDMEKHSGYSYITSTNLPDTSRYLEVDQDPTTRSLLSINSALSGGYYVTPGVSQAQELSNQSQSFISQTPNLCHYHKLMHDTQEGSNLILGHQEEEHQNNHNLVTVNSLPPPPSSRVIEALENSVYYTSNSSLEPNFSQNQLQQ